MRTLTLPEFPSTPALQPALRDLILSQAQTFYKQIADAIENPAASEKANRAAYEKYCDLKLDSMRDYGTLPAYNSHQNWKLHCASQRLDSLYLFALRFGGGLPNLCWILWKALKRNSKSQSN